MAIILKKQRSLYVSALKYIILAFVIAIIGRLLLQVHVFITIVTLIVSPMIIWRSGNFLVGALGEYLVTRELKKFGDNYYVFNDLNFTKMQIDHTLICPKGIFTIETKTYFGKIFGNGNERYWKQYINKAPIRRYSPIKQGRRHSVKLFELLKKKGLSKRIKTIVVFAGPAKVKVAPKPIPVLYRKQLYDYLSRKPDTINEKEILDYKAKIFNLIKNKK